MVVWAVTPQLPLGFQLGLVVLFKQGVKPGTQPAPTGEKLPYLTLDQNTNLQLHV